MAEITIPVLRNDESLYLLQEWGKGEHPDWDSVALLSGAGLGASVIVVDLKRGKERRRYILDAADIVEQVLCLAGETP